MTYTLRDRVVANKLAGANTVVVGSVGVENDLRAVTTLNWSRSRPALNF
jgi:hypothetical protein